MPFFSDTRVTMDDCERLYRRLVHNVRGSAPDLLSRSFEVSKLYQQLVTYRDNRTALGFASIDDYDLAMLQLLSGTRGLIEGEPEMQHALRAELESPNPDLSAYRGFATALVKFGADALREAMLRPTPESSAVVRSVSPQDQARIAARPTESVDTTPTGVAARPVAPAPVAPVSPPVSTTGPVMPAARPLPPPAPRGQRCRYCSGELPEGRSVVYCPCCGHNLTVRHCAACNTELEVGWKFCITCGRGE